MRPTDAIPLTEDVPYFTAREIELDIEKRIAESQLLCKNCKFWGDNDGEWGFCESLDVIEKIPCDTGDFGYPIRHDFGCIHFEPKEK